MEFFFACQSYFRVVSHRIPFIILLIGILMFVTIFRSTEGLSSNKEKHSFLATVTKIVDGDTFEISRAGRTETIRLWGIDSPEWDQPYSNEAKYLLMKTVLDTQILIHPFYYDKFGRLIASVNRSGQNINQLLVEKGLAWVHIYYCNKEICKIWKTKQGNARKQRIGLWSKSQPVPPWQWKHK